MTATMTNGKPRKQLSDQIERLEEQLQRHDAILDVLSERLNGAVADAAKEGTKEAATAAVIELLTNGDLRAALHKASAPDDSPKPTRWDLFRAHVRQVVQKVKAVTAAVATAGSSRVVTAVSAVRRLCGRIRQSARTTVAVQVALAASAVIVGARYFAARQFAMAIGWIKHVALAARTKLHCWVHAFLPVTWN